MSLNETPSANRVRIAFFGVRNAGKSSLVNAFTNQNMSLVSGVKGTTTDTVKKAMELLPIGPVLIIDTPGIDDRGELGEMRVEKAKETLNTADVAVLVVDSVKGTGIEEEKLISVFKERKIPYVIAYNKCDLMDKTETPRENEIYVSAKENININALKEKIGAMAKDKINDKKLVSDLLREGDVIVLVIPIDKSAPKGRLILPQQQVIRDILDSHHTVISCQPRELKQTLQFLKEKPKMIITDSQAFKEVREDVPEDIYLTSFSILFARYKGDLKSLVKSAKTIDTLKDGDRVLISEGCTHHRQCGDIGTVKIPSWLENYTGKKLQYEFTSGAAFPDDLKKYSIIVHCGGCMLTEKEMKYRMEKAEKEGVPMVNYGLLIAYINGILDRAVEPFNL